MMPDTGPFDVRVATSAVSVLFDKVDPAILVTQSQSGGLVRAVVSFEPSIGIRGNTHFPFSDLNNRQIANLVSRFLAKKHLDRFRLAGN